jgi:hypothetical protein
LEREHQTVVEFELDFKHQRANELLAC